MIKGLPELAEYVLEKPAKIGYPKPFGSMTNVMQNPKFSTVLGLLLESRGTPQTKKGKNNNKQISNTEQDIFGRFSDSIKSVFREIF